MNMPRNLLSLALGTFALGLAEFVMMGILTEVAVSLNVSIPDAGDFISAYSLGVACGAPALIILNRYPLNRVLLFLCVLIAGGNLLAACATGYYSLLFGRFVSGLPHGAYFGAGAIVAVNMVHYGQKAMAVSIMVSGMTIANIIGVPLATYLTGLTSWRAPFIMVALAAILAFGGIWTHIPTLKALGHGGKGSIKSQFAFLKKPGPWLIFAGTFAGQGSLYCWYSYMEPIMLQVPRFPASAITWIMALAGAGMFCGALVSGKLADKYQPGRVTGIICILIIPLLLMIYFFSQHQLLALLLTFLGAAGIFALGGPLQYLIVRYAPGGEMLGGAGIQIAFNTSNAFSALLGGWTISAGFGIASPALAGIPLAIIAAIILFSFQRCCPNP